MSQVDFDEDVGGDGSTVTDDANTTTGLANGGYWTRLVPMFTQIIAVANWIKTNGAGYVADALTHSLSAAASATSAILAPGTSATSTTSLTVDFGNKSLTIQTGKSIVVGMSVKIADTVTPANWMHGDVTSYDSGTGALIVNVTLIRGSGTVSAWTISLSGPANITGVGGATPSGSISLIYGDSYSQKVTPTACGQACTVAAATTFNEGRVFSIFNASDFDYAFKDSTGVTRAFIPAWQTCDIGLADNSTAAGQWTFGNYRLLGITATTFHSISIGAGPGIILLISLDTNRSLLLYGNTSCYAKVHRKSTNLWSSPALVRASLGTNAFTAVKSATDQVLVVSNDTTTGMEAVTLSINSSTDVITVNSGSKGTATLAGNWSSYGQLIAVGSSWVVSYGRATNVSGIRAISISGTTPTIGSETALAPANTTPGQLYSVTSSVMLALSSETTVFNSKPYTISGSTISAGTGATTTIDAAAFRSLAVGTRWHAFANNSTLLGIVISVSGTTSTHSTATLSATVAQSPISFVDVLPIDSTKSCFIGSNNSTKSHFNILTDTSGTASAGTELALDTPAAIAANAMSAISVSGTTCRFTATATSSAQIYYTIDASGASPSLSNICESGGGGTDIFNKARISSALSIRNFTQVESTAGVLTVTKMGQTAGAGGYGYGTNLFRLEPLPLPAQGVTSIGVNGLTNSESWFAQLVFNNVIVKVEAAQP